jgi:NAD(P)-dependent dehydrogenase (short-subunit alcohol dehydrogenase family)
MSEKGMPAQHQPRQPGEESMMSPRPDVGEGYRAAGKLEGRVGLITGGDSGIGRAVAVLFAKEGADVSVVYLDEHEDARETKRLVEAEGRRALTIAGDVGDEGFCRQAVEQTVSEFRRLDVLVNNAAEQHAASGIEEITEEHLERTFRTNIFGYFHMTKAALPNLGAGSSIINTSSITAFQGNPKLIDYSSTKGAIVSFTRALSNSLVGQGIRVNGVAPGPIWTPLIPATFSEEQVEQFGKDTPMKRPGQPHEVATCYVFLASDDASYISGQFLHPNGGQVVGS